MRTFISSHAALQGKCEPEGTDISAHDYRPGARMHAYWRMDKRATGDQRSEDQRTLPGGAPRPPRTEHDHDPAENPWPPTISPPATPSRTTPAVSSCTSTGNVTACSPGPSCWPCRPRPLWQIIEHMTDCFSYHPDWAQIDWSAVRWLNGSRPVAARPQQEPGQNNGIGHKDLIRFITPGLDGIAGSGY